MITTEQFELIQRIAAVYHKTLYSDKSLDVIITMMLRAQGLGLPITEAVELFHFQRGKLTLSANAMATLMKRAGYTWVVNDLNDKTADITLYDAQGNELGASVFTWQDAEKANLTNKNTWTEYPRNMLMARALSNAAKWYAPDGFGGAPVYTADEMGSDDDTGYTEPDDTPAEPSNVVDLPAPGDSSEELPGNTEPELPPKTYLREKHWEKLSLDDGSSTKTQRTTIGQLASKLFGSDKAGKAIKAKAVNDFVKQDGVTSVTQLSAYDAEWFWVLLSIDREGQQVYGVEWEKAKRESAVNAYTDDVTGVLWDMPRQAACKLLDRLERERADLAEAKAKSA